MLCPYGLKLPSEFENWSRLRESENGRSEGTTILLKFLLAPDASSARQHGANRPSQRKAFAVLPPLASSGAS